MQDDFRPLLFIDGCLIKPGILHRHSGLVSQSHERKLLVSRIGFSRALWPQHEDADQLITGNERRKQFGFHLFQVFALLAPQPLKLRQNIKGMPRQNDRFPG